LSKFKIKYLSEVIFTLKDYFMNFYKPAGGKNEI
jgi:hypothetical protein